MKKLLLTSLAITVILFSTSCHSLWEPSDTEAVDLVESYYLFYQSGKEVDAEIIERKKFDRKCKCFPIRFRIISDQERFERTFYFFKNETGQIEVSTSIYGIRQ